jgi:hypothetical protein
MRTSGLATRRRYINLEKSVPQNIAWSLPKIDMSVTAEPHLEDEVTHPTLNNICVTLSRIKGTE